MDKSAFLKQAREIGWVFKCVWLFFSTFKKKQNQLKKQTEKEIIRKPYLSMCFELLKTF